MSLAEKLVTLRKQKGMTQMDLAEKLNVSRQAISRWEVGAAVPGTDNLKVLSNIYGVSINYLLDDVINEPDSSRAEQSNEEKDISMTHVNGKGHRKTVIFFLILIVVIAIILSLGKIDKLKEDKPIPIEDMDVDDGDNYSTELFHVEW